MPTQEEQLALISTAATDLTAEVLIAKAALVAAELDFTATITRVNALNNVNNTSDANKPISLAAGLLDSLNVKKTELSTINGQSLDTGQALVVERGQVEIPTLEYTNRASLRAPIIPLPGTGDVVNIPRLGHFQYSTSFNYLDDDDMVFEAVDPSDGTTPIGQWVMVLPAYEWLEAQKLFENAVLWEWMEDEQLRFSTY
jgi:hypothetical protein